MSRALITLIDSHPLVKLCNKASAGFRGQRSVKTTTAHMSVPAKELAMLVYCFLTLSIKESHMRSGTSLYDNLKILCDLIIR